MECEYVLNVVCDQLRFSPEDVDATKLIIQIDVVGTLRVIAYSVTGEYQEIYTIQDHIPVPSYMIAVFKQLLPEDNCLHTNLYWHHYMNVIESIKTFKQTYERPNNRLLAETRLNLESDRQVETSKLNYLIKTNAALEEENKEVWELLERIRRRTKLG